MAKFDQKCRCRILKNEMVLKNGEIWQKMANLYKEIW
jgi:hypothetical protein